MKKITPIEQLQEQILLLEAKRVNDEALLKAEFKTTFESIKPINIIKNILDELIDLPDFKEDIVDTTLGLVTGYLSKKVVFGSTHSPIKQILGSLLQVGVTSLVTKNADGIKSFASHIIDNIFSKNDKPS